MFLGDNIFYHKAIAKALGVRPAIVFGYLCQEAERSEDRKVSITVSRIAYELGMTEGRTRCSLKTLVEAKFLTASKVGFPAHYVYSINRKDVLDFFSAASKKE